MIFLLAGSSERAPSARMKKAISRLLFPGGIRGIAFGLALVIVATTGLYVPAALAFPYQAQIGTTAVYSTDPIPPVMTDRIARADKLLAESPLYEPGLRRTLVLTDGGWRWRVMAAGYWGTVALRRPFSSTLIFNRSDVATDRIASVGGERTLSGTIAHETVHILTARRLGELRMARLPRWKREGYADFVARETSLRPDDEARIRARSPDAPVLEYYEGRRRVAAELQRNGGSVDALLAR